MADKAIKPNPAEELYLQQVETPVQQAIINGKEAYTVDIAVDKRKALEHKGGPIEAILDAILYQLQRREGWFKQDVDKAKDVAKAKAEAKAAAKQQEASEEGDAAS